MGTAAGAGVGADGCAAWFGRGGVSGGGAFPAAGGGTGGTHGGTIGTLPGDPLLEPDVPILNPSDCVLDGLIHVSRTLPFVERSACPGLIGDLWNYAGFNLAMRQV